MSLATLRAWPECRKWSGCVGATNVVSIPRSTMWRETLAGPSDLFTQLGTEVRSSPPKSAAEWARISGGEAVREVSYSKLQQLLDMGFPKAASLDALRDTQSNLDCALEKLLATGDNTAFKPTQLQGSPSIDEAAAPLSELHRSVAVSQKIAGSRQQRCSFGTADNAAVGVEPQLGGSIAGDSRLS